LFSISHQFLRKPFYSIKAEMRLMTGLSVARELTLQHKHKLALPSILPAHRNPLLLGAIQAEEVALTVDPGTVRVLLELLLLKTLMLVLAISSTGP
jgi:hypothetical protein